MPRSDFCSSPSLLARTTMQLRHAISDPQLAASASLHSASSETTSQYQQLLLLAETAAAAGDLDVAYCLYAKCHAAAASIPACIVNHHQQAQAARCLEQASSGRLHTLAAMCKEQPILSTDDTYSTVPAKTSAQSNSSTPEPTPKRWLQIQRKFRLQHSPSCSLSSSPARLLAAAHLTSPAQSSSSSSPAEAGVVEIDSSCSRKLHCSCGSMNRRMFCVSDLHIDRAGGANLAWLRSISSTAFQNDVLLVAGDVADTAAAVRTAFQLLSGRFGRVVWVPGNHELWLRSDTQDKGLYPDSWSKLMALRQMADAAGIDTGPLEVCPGLLVVPLLSWYNSHFDVQDPRPGVYRHDSFCNWGPVPENQVWQVMLRLNTNTLSLVQHYISTWQQQQQQHQCSMGWGHQQQQQGQQRQLSDAAMSIVGHPEQALPQQQLRPPVATSKLSQLLYNSKQVNVQQQTASDAVLHHSSRGSQHPHPDIHHHSTPPSRHHFHTHQQHRLHRFHQHKTATGVSWSQNGFLAVSSSRGLRVPGLQLNLTPYTRRSVNQPPQPSHAAAGGYPSATAGKAETAANTNTAQGGTGAALEPAAVFMPASGHPPATTVETAASGGEANSSAAEGGTVLGSHASTDKGDGTSDESAAAATASAPAVSDVRHPTQQAASMPSMQVAGTPSCDNNNSTSAAATASSRISNNVSNSHSSSDSFRTSKSSAGCEGQDGAVTGVDGPACRAPASSSSSGSLTVITLSHFLPHPQLPHSRMAELSKAMGCAELQLQMQQVHSTVHVCGHSHRCADITLQSSLQVPAESSSANSSSSAAVTASASASSGTTGAASGAVSNGYQHQQQQDHKQHQHQHQHEVRYIQYALDAVGSQAAGLYCIWDGELLPAGRVVPIC